MGLKLAVSLSFVWLHLHLDILHCVAWGCLFSIDPSSLFVELCYVSLCSTIFSEAGSSFSMQWKLIFQPSVPQGTLPLILHVTIYDSVSFHLHTLSFLCIVHVVSFAGQDGLLVSDLVISSRHKMKHNYSVWHSRVHYPFRRRLALFGLMHDRHGQRVDSSGICFHLFHL